MIQFTRALVWIGLIALVGWASGAAQPLAAGPLPQEDPKEESEEEKVSRREEAKAREYKGVPWLEAAPLQSDHFVLTTNCSRELGEEYLDLLEAARAAHVEFFKGHPVASKGRSRVWLAGNHDEFIGLIRDPRTTSLYIPRARGGVPERTVLTYHHGGFEATRGTREHLLHGATYQFLDLIVDNLWNAPVWLVIGLAVFFESSRFEEGEIICKEKDSREVGIVPAGRLVPLQSGIKAGKGRYVPLKQLIRTPEPRFGGYHYSHGWSLVHWICNADGGKHRSMLDDLLKIAGKRPITPEEVEGMLKEATGHDIGDFEEKVWKPYVLALEPPPTGVIEGGRFTSKEMKLQVSLPGGGWAWDQKDLPVHLQARMKMTEVKAAIEIGAVMASFTIKDLMKKGLDGLFEDAVAEARMVIENIVLDPWAEDEEGEIKEERLSLRGYRAVRFEYEAPVDDPEEESAEEEVEDEDFEEDEDDEETVTRFLVLIPTVERRYEIRAECPTPQADKVRAAFDEVVRSFKILP